MPSLALLTCAKLASSSRIVPCLQGQAYTDAGATAYDAVDGALNDIATTGLSYVKLASLVKVHPNMSTVSDKILLRRSLNS